MLSFNPFVLYNKRIIITGASSGIGRPGTVLTPLMDEFLQTLSDEERENRLSGFPLGIGQPSDISYACIYLLSEASRWITGQNIVIDGGYTIK